jgi:hypothetical protein
VPDTLLFQSKEGEIMREEMTEDIQALLKKRFRCLALSYYDVYSLKKSKGPTRGVEERWSKKKK